VIHIVDWSNRTAYARQLDAFAQMGEALEPESPGTEVGFQLSDISVGGGAIHLLDLDQFGNLRAGVAVLASTRPAGILIPKHLRIAEASEIAKVLLAVFEYCLAAGCAQVKITHEANLLNVALRTSKKSTALSLDALGSDHVTTIVELSYGIVDWVRTQHNLQGPVLVYQAAPTPHPANDNCRLRLHKS
jgi:hypothetical protein